MKTRRLVLWMVVIGALLGTLLVFDWNSTSKLGQAALPLLLGGITGGVLGGIAVLLTWWWQVRQITAQQLLSEALRIQSMKEAWILDGNEFRANAISDNRGLSTVPKSDGLWLRRVEIRFVLDEAPWNAPDERFYDVLSGRRAWIVRDKLVVPSTSTALRVEPHPALISSRGMEEMIGWAQQVEDASVHAKLSKRGEKMLWPLLIPVSSPDKLAVFRRFPHSTQKFLERIYAKYLEEHPAGQQSGEGPHAGSRAT